MNQSQNIEVRAETLDLTAFIEKLRQLSVEDQKASEPRWIWKSEGRQELSGYPGSERCVIEVADALKAYPAQSREIRTEVDAFFSRSIGTDKIRVGGLLKEGRTEDAWYLWRAEGQMKEFWQNVAIALITQPKKEVNDDQVRKVGDDTAVEATQAIGVNSDN